MRESPNTAISLQFVPFAVIRLNSMAEEVLPTRKKMNNNVYFARNEKNNKCDFAQADGNKNGVSAVVDKSLVGAIANLLLFVDAPTSTTFSSICHANLIRRKPNLDFFRTKQTYLQTIEC